MALVQGREVWAAVPALLLLFSAVVLRDTAAPRVEELVSSSGLQQTGAGMQLASHPYDVAASPADARLADQIHEWDQKDARLKAAAPGYIPATGTQQLAQVPASTGSLSTRIKSAVNSLRLGDFLTGVKPYVEEAQVQSLYAKMDPKDTTGWMSRENLIRESPARVQARLLRAKRLKMRKVMSTTKNEDSPQQEQVRRALRKEIQRKASTRKPVSTLAALQSTSKRFWTQRSRHNFDVNDLLIHQLASPEDRDASYAAWLSRTKGKDSRARNRAVGMPRVTAGGQLAWRSKVHTKLHQKHARLQKLAEDDTAPSHMQQLSEEDNKLGASEITMREILGNARRAAHANAARQRAHADRNKMQGEKMQGARDFAVSHHQQLASKPAISNSDLVSDATGRTGDSEESIRERAAYKVSRWMGGGYVDVYGR
jgi:hypothetical protein